ncbi:MAG: class I SAM-dependent methyltransferase [Spirochaetota bacterium]
MPRLKVYLISMSFWDHAYVSGRVAWDPGEYDRHVPWFLDHFRLEPCRVLDAGCGNGKSAVWLAERGFHVVGIDLSPTAVEQARSRARSRGVAERCEFHEGRFPNAVPSRAPGGPLAPKSFGLITERAFVQHLRRGRATEDTLQILADALEPGGMFYSLMVAAEGESGHWGIVRWSQQQIRSVFEPHFEILEMHLDVFTPGEPGSVPAWITVMRRVSG